jgi:hypothetical protein
MKRYNSIDAIEFFTTGFLAGFMIALVIAYLIIEHLPEILL